MCYNTRQTRSATALSARFEANVEIAGQLPTGDLNGFDHPRAPVIADNDCGLIRLSQWGLVPAWAEDTSIADKTLNARMETISEKPAFRESAQRRCLVLADGFYEWQWRDSKGKKKQKFLLHLPEDEPFGFAGIWGEWTDRNSGGVLHTYSILTTEANRLMAEIHNHKKRMPVILARAQEREWLKGGDLIMQNDRLKAAPLYTGGQQSLFD